jgi:uncharacterized protein (TIGR02646 family)
MRHIRKGAEPKRWLQFRKQKVPAPRFDDGPKDDLRKALLKEQGHLCCYCMRRIEDGPGGMKIEHWAPRRLEPLAYANLLGACDGAEGSPPSGQHCDTAKRDQVITLDPRHASCEAQVVFTASGEAIASAGAPPSVEPDLETLNLNVARLRRGRAGAIEAIRSWAATHGKSLSRRQLLAKADALSTPDAHGRLPVFLGVTVAWLRKHAQQRP